MKIYKLFKMKTWQSAYIPSLSAFELFPLNVFFEEFFGSKKSSLLAAISLNYSTLSLDSNVNSSTISMSLVIVEQASESSINSGSETSIKSSELSSLLIEADCEVTKKGKFDVKIGKS